MRLRLSLLLASISLLAAVPGCQTRPAAPPAAKQLGAVLVCGGKMMNGEAFDDAVAAVMREHFGHCRKVALVLHADHPSARDRREKQMARAFELLAHIPVESLHHHDAAGQLRLLREADGIFVGGGETFALLAELYRTGQLELIRKRVRSGVPYMGTSAGANVAGLRIGTTNDFPVADVPTRESLGIFPAVINPHHPLPEEAEFGGRRNKIIGYLRFNPREQVLGLGNAAIVHYHDGEVTVVVAPAWLYQTGSVRELKLGDKIPELLTPAAQAAGPKS